MNKKIESQIDYYDRMLELVYAIDWPGYSGYMSGPVDYPLERAALEKVLYYIKLGVSVRDLEKKLDKKNEELRKKNT